MPAEAWANLGAEEPDAPRASARAELVPLAALFRAVIERPEPVFAWLPRDALLVAWFNSESAAAAARERSRSLFGATPEVARRCHDKAFAQWVAACEGLQPPLFREAVTAFSPSELEPGAALDATLVRLRERLDAAPTAHGFTLKPRLGTSGRGRVPLRSVADLAAQGDAWPRLRRTGGALLEPWAARSADFSVTLYVSSAREITIIGSAELLVTPSGVYRGHRGFVDARGRMTSGSPFDEALREAAVVMATAAAEQGYVGVCGVDAFVFEHAGRATLRPIVEFNARFTVGFLVAASLRMRLREMVSRAGLRPDHPLAFGFDLAEVRSQRPPLAAGAVDLELPISEESLRSDLARSGDADVSTGMPRRWPRLCVAPSSEQLPADAVASSEGAARGRT